MSTLNGNARNPRHLSMAFTSLPRIDGKQPQRIVWDNLRGVAASVAAIETTLATRRAGIYLADNAAHAHRLLDELRFVSDSRLKIVSFPDWETMAYDCLSPDTEISATRIAMLADLPRLSGLCVVSLDNLMRRVAPPDFIQAKVFSLRIGDTLDSRQFIRKLDENGYIHAGHISAPGEYAVRGSLIDFYPPNATAPVRIDLFDDKIENLRLFDVETQTSHSATDFIRVLPAREVPLDERSVTTFRRAFRATFDGAPEDSPVYRDISDGRAPEGIEFYAPLFFKEMRTLFDYFPDDALIFHSDAWENLLKQTEKQIRKRAEILEEARPLLPFDALYADVDEIGQRASKHTCITLRSTNAPRARTHHANTQLVRGVAINRQAADPLSNLKKLIATSGGRTLFTAVSAGYLDRLTSTLSAAGLRPTPVSGWLEFLSRDDDLCICIGKITGGAVFKRAKQAKRASLLIVSDDQVFGYMPSTQRRQTHSADSIVGDLKDLETGCPIVHEEHGVGRYRGLSTLTIGGAPADFLVIEYADNDKLYVPVSAIHLVTKYVRAGVDEGEAPLHKLGGANWKKAKRKAKQKAYDIAAQLLDTHARRDLTQGTRFDSQTKDYSTFCGQFTYEETPDQTQAMREIEQDMESLKPMDRIICGDVGFGKTELAMRAAFLAIHAHRQVALLTPTTLLAQQHNQNFHTRFADWPVRIATLSRFNSRAEQKETLRGLEDGSIDLVIGTHRLLQKDVAFKNPGLFIVDEEQRFGVRHKEKLKSMRVDMDLLTLTATPIPRTLSVSLNGIRDISIIATPPPHRRPVKTIVTQWDAEMLREACRRELHRGGQIYFLSNRVENIEEALEKIRDLIPEASIRIAHGQMSEVELEVTMQDFYNRRFDILLCTTIIESGLDIPSVNTIIILSAEKFGLAQLHQLRGRVGRAHRQAYAYMVIDRPLTAMPVKAARRLETLDSLTELGVGFSLASHDLEMRGAGELLGFKQSGSASEVGFRMYHDMVKRAVDALRSGQVSDFDKPLNLGVEVDMGVPSLITEDYVPDVNLRLLLYRRLATIKSPESLENMHAEMIDRFGPMPEYTVNLFRNTALKIRGRRFGVVRMQVGAESGHFYFSDKPSIDTRQLIRMVADSPARYRLDNDSRFTFRIPMETAEERYSTLGNLFDRLDTMQTST